MMYDYLPRFVCPRCGSERLYELTDKNHYQSVLGVNEIREAVYDPEDSWDTDPVNDRYQCPKCGFKLKDDEGVDIYDQEGLAAWLIRQEEIRRKSQKFVCPECSGRELEDEVIDEDTVPLERLYHCKTCGYRLEAKTEEELTEWLKSHRSPERHLRVVPDPCESEE